MSQVRSVDPESTRTISSAQPTLSKVWPMMASSFMATMATDRPIDGKCSIESKLMRCNWLGILVLDCRVYSIHAWISGRVPSRMEALDHEFPDGRLKTKGTHENSGYGWRRPRPATAVGSPTASH